MKVFNLQVQSKSMRNSLRFNLDLVKEVLNREDVHILDVKIAISALQQILETMEILPTDFIDSESNDA